MANQPVKKKFDYEKYFSYELKGLLDYIGTDIAGEISFASLTFDIFLVAAIDYKDSMLYKALNGYLTSADIEELHDKVLALVSDNVEPVRPGRTIDYSTEMKHLFVLANEMREELKAKAITSDIILLAFIQTASKSNKIKKILSSYGLTESVTLDLVRKLLDTVSSISTMTEEQFDDFADKYMTTVDTSSSESYTTVTIFGAGNYSSTDDFIDAIRDVMGSDQAPQEKTVEKKNKVEFCESLNAAAEKGEMEPTIGREKEMFEIAKVLNRKYCNNVVLVGDPGVGKTAIVNGLAMKLVKGNAPLSLKDCEIFKLDLPAMESGSQFRGQFEQKMNSLIKNLRKVNRPILFIDNIHSFVNERKNAEFDVFGELEPAFSDKKIMIIVTTTPKGFHQSFEGMPDTMRKFQKITVESPDEKECLEILEGIKANLEPFHKIKYEDGTLKVAMSLAQRYITERCLPSSAIDLLDEAGSLKKIEHYEPKSIYVKKNKIATLRDKKDKMIKANEGSSLKDIDYEIDGLNIDISEAMDKINASDVPTVTVEDLCRATSEHTGIPVSRVSASEKQQLAGINNVLMKNIVGQDEAIDVICRGIKRNKVGLVQKNRPILSCMCIGNTGCGKTLLAKMLAKEIFGDEKYLVRFDMSEYADKTAVNKLIGAGAGYVGYNEGGLLTEAIKNKKHAVLLIDEIEKATEEIFNIFLQVLDEGFLTDNTGVKVDFKNVILILTSNVGAKRAANEKAIGFAPDDNSSRRDIIEKELKNCFPPEFLNRLDEIVYFNSLTDDNLKDIVKLELSKLGDKIMQIGCTVEFSDDVADYIFKKIESEKGYGARPIGRAIQKEIENAITDYILENECEGKHFYVRISDGKVQIA